MTELSKKPRFTRFSNAKDRALEFLLLKARAKCADDLRHFMALVQAEVGRTYPILNKDFLDPHTRNQIKDLQNSIDRHAYAISLEMSLHWMRLRMQAYKLAHTGMQQAVIQTANGNPKHLSRSDIQGAAFKNTSLGPVADRSYLSLSRLARDVIDAVEMSRIMGDDLKDCMDRVLKCFPAAEEVKYQRVLQRIKESQASRGEKLFGASDFMDDQEWQELVGDYKEKFVPLWRDPRDPSGEAFANPVSVGDRDTVALYPYQLENEMTEDFVSQVRKGEHEGANAQGITDFVWIDVVDKHTDECCLKRGGLTTAEIEKKLAGEWSKDKCRATVPPAHFNCRCRLGPATDDLPDAPESNEADFEEWLNS